MRTKLLSLFVVIIGVLLSFGALGQGTETFENETSNSSSSTSRSWLGQDGSTWTAEGARTDQTITGVAITLNDDTPGAQILSGTISGGVGNISVKTHMPFSDNGTEPASLYINTTFIGTLAYSSSVQTISFTNVNISGDFYIKITNDDGEGRISFDDITWTAYSAPSCSGEPTAQATGVTASNATATTLDVSWTAGTGGDEYILVCREGSSVSWTPTDGTDYSAQTGSGDFSTATDQSSGNKVVFSGSGTSTTVTGLSASTTYYFQVFNLCSNDSDNYLTSSGTGNDGSQTGTTTAVSWCTSNGDGTDTYEAVIRNVTFGSIDVDSPKEDNAYTDNTSSSTDLQQGGSENLSVSLCTDGSYTYNCIVWIDWNQDGTFNTSDEEFDLGTVNGSDLATTTLSPLSINIPAGATLGSTRMRVSMKYNADPTSCETGFDGEVEDYSVNIIASSPTITLSTSTLTGFNYIEGAGPSAEQSFTVEGTNLTNDISITAPTNYEISTGTGGSFSATSPITLTQSGGDVSTTTIYVRLKSGLTAGDYNGENITASSTGATNQTVACSGTVYNNADWCNLQSPGSATIASGQNLTVYARIYENGLTTNSGEQGTISCDIGYSASNTNPNTWTNWEPATFNIEVGNNDEYMATFGDDFTSGTYYYASRFSINGGSSYAYGGYNAGGGNFWDGTSNVSGVLTVNDNYADFCNVNDPASGTITVGDNFTVESKIWEDGVTNIGSPGAGITSWIGYSTTNTNPSGWTNWIPASFSGDAVNDDLYEAEIGSSLSAGTYYYASRFRVDPNNEVYSYGGLGGVWGGGNVSGVLTVNPPPTITVSGTPFTDFTYEVGNGPSSEQSFTIEGNNLTNDINLTPPANYEISTGTGGSFVATNPITLTQSGGNVSSTNIYVRLKSGLAVGTYNSEDISATSTGATTQTVTCNGEVTPTNFYCDDFEGTLSGWTVTNDSDPNAQVEISNTWGGANSSSNAALFEAPNPASVTYYTSTIEKTFNNTLNLSVDFYYYFEDYRGGEINVLVNSTEVYSIYTDAGAGDIEITDATDDQWIYISLDLSSSTSTADNYTITIEGISKTADYYKDRVAVDELCIYGELATACSEPANPPTSLVLNSNTTYNSIDGSFTSSSGTPGAHGYLVIRSTSSSLSGDPVDGTTYTAGESLGGGTVVYSGSNTFFTASSLTESTQYYFFVFAYQNTACSGGPEYLTSSYLSGNETTTAGPSISLGTLTAFGNVCLGTTAGPNSFTISGTNLTTDDIEIAALSGYTYSTTAGGTYTSTLTISGHGGGTYNTTIYVKFTPVAATTYNGNIAISGAGITGSENCSASGTGIALPTITGTTPGSVCNSGTVNLSATASAGTMDWYNVSTGGSSLYTGANFTTPSISSTTSYWVETDDGTCTSNRTEVVATVNTSPAITSSLTASGTTGNAFSYFITGSYSPTSYNATGLPAGLSINTSTGEISGTPSATGVTNVTISATNACGTGNETLVITISTFTYLAGDYRSTTDYVEFSWNNPAGTTDYWEYYDGSSWGPTPSDNAPENAATTPGRIIIDHIGINAGGNTTNTYNDIIIRNGGQLILTDDDNPPVASEFINANKKIEVQNGGELLIQGDMDLPADGSLIVRDGGILIIDQESMRNDHPFWDGVENFEAGSEVKIVNWDFGGTATYVGLYNITNSISNNTEGYKFGYLTVDADTDSDWAWCGGSYGVVVNLVYNDAVVDNAGNGYIGAITNKTSSPGYVINGDLIINSGNFNFSATYNTDDFEHQATVNGDFEFNSTGTLYLHRNGASTPGTMTKGSDSYVEFKGNVTVNSAATFANDVATDNTRMYMVINGSGTESVPQLLDIGVTTGMTGIDTYINNNTFVQLASNNWIFNGISGLTTGITLETGSSLHFGWADDNTTPLIITMPGGAVGTNQITTETGTTLYMTHAQGLDDGTNATNGNVQQFTQANRSFNQVANFWYVGKVNQVTGNGITTASTNKVIGLNMGSSTYETTLSDDITTSGKLILMNGVLKTTSSELLTLEDNATVHTDASGSNGEPGSANSWVDGPFNKIGNDAFVFPLGENIWAPIGISAPSNATDEFSGEYFNSAYSDITNMDATIDEVSDQDYWDITSVVGSSIPTVTAYWKDNRYGIADFADVVVAHYTGGSWKDKGNTNSSGTVANGSIDNSTAFASFSPITLGFKNTPTPVELLSFDAVRNNSIVDIEWTTASEQNNDFFTIERSLDAQNFEFVVDIKGNGNSNKEISYSTIDFNPFSTKSYYRLKQTDFDGKYTYSDIVEVKGVYDLVDNNITISKKPSAIHINIADISYPNECSIVIFDMLGRVLYKQDYKSFSNDIFINNIDFKKGIYNVSIIYGDKVKTEKIVW